MIAVIADDLTGAAELGAVGDRYGLNAEVVTGMLLQDDEPERRSPTRRDTSDLNRTESKSPAPADNADLICIDTDSRSCPPEEARRQIGRAHV